MPNVVTVGQTGSANYPVLNPGPFAPVYQGGSSDSFFTVLGQPF